MQFISTEMMVNDEALAFLESKGICFSFNGPANYEHPAWSFLPANFFSRSMMAGSPRRCRESPPRRGGLS
jgi:hypothetical protein